MTRPGWRMDPEVLKRERETIKKYKEWTAAIRAEQLEVQTRINLTDDNYACEHDALPLDRKKPAACECWTPEATEALRVRRQAQGWF